MSSKAITIPARMNRRTYSEPDALSVKEAVEIASQLSEVFADVVVLADRSRPVVRAREHLKYHKDINCYHPKIRRARNVLACIKVGADNLEPRFSNPDIHGLFKYEFIETCMHCDAIINFKHAIF